jgi:uncharacterized membrane protein
MKNMLKNIMMNLVVVRVNQRNIVKALLFLCFGYLSYLMILITLQYIPVNLHSAFLQVKTDQVQWPHYNMAFFIHVYTSIFILFAGFIQFSSRIRKAYPKLHKSTGKFYILAILILAGPSGLLMGYYANGGIISQVSFCLLAVIWILFTWIAFKKAREGNFKEHRYWMYRSYALTLSAISLRLFKWIIVLIWHPGPMDTYRIVAWLGWIINLVICEFIILNQAKQIYIK